MYFSISVDKVAEINERDKNESDPPFFVSAVWFKASTMLTFVGGNISYKPRSRDSTW